MWRCLLAVCVLGVGCGGEVCLDDEVYIDRDGDGFGQTPAGTTCLQDGLVAIGGDCDDDDPDRNPGAQERCNQIDDDCDRDIDEGTPTATFYRDADGDRWGSADTVEACAAPDGFVDRSGDCDDAHADVFPGAAEVCDGVDNDCDALVDADDPDLPAGLWFADADQDGFGDWSDAIDAVQCDAPPGRVPNAEDCDDTLDSVFPGASEVCNGIDDDCDAIVDDADPDLPPSLLTEFFGDDDGDGFGNPADVALSCDAPNGFVGNAWDCAPYDPRIGWVGPVSDADADGAVVPDGAPCTFGVSITDVTVIDCAPDDATVYPNAPEVPGDGVDQDCDGLDQPAE